MKLIAGSSNKTLANRIANCLHTSLVDCLITRFGDGEVKVEINESVRGEDVFVIQSTSIPVNDNLVELLILIDALKRGSAKRITAVMPYFGYSRQDRKTSSRAPISAKLVADMLTVAGVDRVISLDLHASQIQGFFNCAVDNLFGNILFVNDIKQHEVINDQLVIVSADIGGVVRSRSVAKWLDCDLAIIDKRRPVSGVSEVMNIIGNVENKNCIIIDDMADSCGTLCNASKALIEAGAVMVKAYITHGVFSGNAIEKIHNSNLSALHITDSIEYDINKMTDKISIISCDNLLSNAILCSHNETSMDSLFLSRSSGL